MEILASLSSWLTPTSLFVFLNLVIGTIYLTSRLASPPPSNNNKHSQYYPPPAPLARAPSLLDRVRSINFSMHNFPEPETGSTDHTGQFRRAPSLLDRVRSIDFSIHKFPEPETGFTDDPVQLHRAPSLLDRVRSIDFSIHKFPEPKTSSTRPQPDHPVQVLHRAPSLLERVRSINLSSFYRSESECSELETELEHCRPAAEMMRKSASERAVGMEDEEDEREEESRAELRSSKSESVLQKTASFGDEAVDAKADDFINRFKDQLRLQRLESLLRSKAK